MATLRVTADKYRSGTSDIGVFVISGSYPCETRVIIRNSRPNRDPSVVNKLKQLVALVANVRNPRCAIADGLGLQKESYVLHLRNRISIELRPGAGDLFGFYETMLRGDYTRNSQRINIGDTVIDVGANIGCFSLLASSLVGDGGKVISLEPEISTFEQLRNNIRLNRAKNITPLRMALSNKNGMVELNYTENSLLSSMFDSVDGRDKASCVQKVPTMTLPGLMDKENVRRCDYLKLDCEGAEYQILDSLDRDHADRISQVVAEIHTIPEHDPDEIKRKLEEFGFTLKGKGEVHYFCR